jgi:hypothetical protein
MKINVPASQSQVRLYLTDARFKFLVDSMVPIFLKGVEQVVHEMDGEEADKEAVERITKQLREGF